MMTVASYFKNLFKKKTPPVSFTMDTAEKGFDPKKEVLARLVRKPHLSHDEMNTLAHLYFNTIIQPKAFFVRRHGNGYGDFYNITAVHLEVVDMELKDIHITLADAGLETSLKMMVSVKDFNEVFKPYVPDLSFLTKT